MTIKLRYYQEESLNAIYHYFMANSGNPLIGLPTGTGKSVLPAEFIRRVMTQWPNQRFLLLTTVKELIEQNFEVLKMVWPNAPAGIFSAGLKRKETAFPIIFAGLQSAIKNPSIFGHRDLIWIDEAHMVNQDQASMYLTFIAAMKAINPAVKVVGMSATLFRMGQGYIVDSGLFTDVVYNMTGLHGFNKLIEEGHLATLIPKRTKTELDVSGVQIVKGEYAQGPLQKAVDREEITLAGLRELVEAGYNRKSWLIFASGIEHSDHIAAMLESFGIECASVHSKQKPEYNDGAIKAFKNFELRAISNYGKLTTGFNHPNIDLIGMFRPTMSVPLWVQMLGRGTRPAEGKNDCLVLDFARNTPRLGCINDPAIPKKKGDKPGDAPVKLCEACGAYNYAGARFCCDCGAEFIFQTKLVSEPGTAPLIKRLDDPIIETFPVDYVIYARQENKMGKPPYIRATYFSGLRAFKQNVFPQHGGMSRKIFRDWWRQRSKEEPPLTTDDALRFVSTLRKPKTIRVHVNLKYPEILSVQY